MLADLYTMAEFHSASSEIRWRIKKKKEEEEEESLVKYTVFQKNVTLFTFAKTWLNII